MTTLERARYTTTTNIYPYDWLLDDTAISIKEDEDKDECDIQDEIISNKKIFFRLPQISPIIDIDNSSSKSKITLLEYRTETVFAENIYKMIEKIRALENVIGLLNDLDQCQIEIFDSSIKRRPLFE